MTVDYQTISQDDIPVKVAARLAHLLTQGRSVLWLLSGGSGGGVCVEASKLLVSKGLDLSRLYATFSDERYGEIDHIDENFKILQDGGFRLPGANLYRPLQEGMSIGQVSSALSDWISKVSEIVDYRFAVMGIGADGHTAGIKPYSPAVLSDELAEGFQADDFERITVTPKMLRSLDEAIIQAYGHSKHEKIAQIMNEQGSLIDTPALIIHEIPKVSMYSDTPWYRESA